MRREFPRSTETTRNKTPDWGPSPICAESYGKGPCGCQSGITTSTRRAELAGQPEILRKIMAHMSQCAQCSPTGRRIVRNETGSDPGGQHCAKYRILGLSRGVRRASSVRRGRPSTLRTIRYRRFSHGWGCYPTARPAAATKVVNGQYSVVRDGTNVGRTVFVRAPG